MFTFFYISFLLRNKTQLSLPVYQLSLVGSWKSTGNTVSDGRCYVHAPGPPWGEDRWDACMHACIYIIYTGPSTARHMHARPWGSSRFLQCTSTTEGSAQHSAVDHRLCQHEPANHGVYVGFRSAYCNATRHAASDHCDRRGRETTHSC